MTATKSSEEKSLTFLAVSGISFPTKKRQYLMTLFKQVADKHKPKFIIVAGHTVDGASLEKELKAFLQYTLKEEQRVRKESKDKEPFDKEAFKKELEGEFIDSHAQDLNRFLPRIENANYHIAISDKVYDRPIGARILEKLGDLRDDIRLIGRQKDGSYDPEPKLGSSMKGFEEIRVIVPRKHPWYYRIISAFMQRLINTFIQQTFSPPPNMILVGCTGTASYLPFYEGVPCVSVPALHKIEEQTSTENMVGISVVRVNAQEDGIRIANGVYDLRPAIFSEKQFAIPADAARMEKNVLKALVPSDSGLKIILFRMNAARKKSNGNGEINEDKVKKALASLKKQGIVSYNSQSNRYAINEELIRKADISLDNIFEGSKTVKHTIVSCFHCGCLKSLYYSALHYLPQNAAESDELIENGDGIQGISHNYEYNGDLLPIAYGFDKQEILAANIRAKNILDIFRLKYARLRDKKLSHLEILRKCTIRYTYNLGNHPSWNFYNKDALILQLFDTTLRQKLSTGLLLLCKELGLKDVDCDLIPQIVAEKIVRVGESSMVTLGDIVVGIKHPFKGRTQAKSHRIQDVVDFMYRNFKRFRKLFPKQIKGFAVTYIANFHECATVHVVKFGRTVLGVMTGAYLHDTSFESNLDKVVDWGSANVTAVISQDDRLLYSEVEYDNRIDPNDEPIVLADRVKTSDVLKLCSNLIKMFDLHWR